MEQWLKTADTPFKKFINARQFIAATVLLTIGGFIVTFLGAAGSQDGAGVHLVIAIQAIILINAFVPHIAATFWYRQYQPGVVTAVLVNIPFSIFFFYRVLSAGSISRGELLFLFLISPVAMFVIARIAQILGGSIVGLFKKSEAQ